MRFRSPSETGLIFIFLIVVLACVGGFAVNWVAFFLLLLILFFVL